MCQGSQAPKRQLELHSVQKLLPCSCGSLTLSFIIWRIFFFFKVLFFNSRVSGTFPEKNFFFLHTGLIGSKFDLSH